MTGKSDLATLAALGLTAKLLPPPHALSDVRLLVQGRLHLWPAWSRQPGPVRDLVAKFLSHRPDHLAEERALLERLRRLLATGDDFEPTATDDEGGTTWRSEYRVVPGAGLDGRIREWMDLLDSSARSGSRRPNPVLDGSQDLQLTGGGQSYRIPISHVPERVDTPLELRTAPNLDPLVLDVGALRGCARALDGSAEHEVGLYERVAVEQFVGQLTGPGARPVETVVAGITKLAVAPTGTGKSVFARLLALHVARSGTPVALVVPDIHTVWREVLRLESAAAAAELDLRVVALSSWRNLADRVGDHLDNLPKEDPDGAWALRTAAYTCHLQAYAEGPAPQIRPGSEPCTRLRQADANRGKAQRVTCPFQGQCGRFSAFERAVDADVLVVNHHAFLAGRVPRDTCVDGDNSPAISTAELVLRRCGLVLIDEIDAFQDTAIGSDSRGLALSSRGGLSKPHRLNSEVEQRRAENRLDASVRFERGRSALLRIIHEAERLSELVNRGELDWPERGAMIWRGAHDAWLANRLYGDDAHGFDRIRALFDARAVEDEHPSELLRLALAPLARGLGDGTLVADVRADIMTALNAWPAVLGRPAIGQQARSRIADRLIVRAALVQLDQALDHLRPQLPGLEQQDVVQASQLRDDLLGYAPWQPSPAGPLGHRLHGYAFDRRLNEPGALETRIISGDPHGLVLELGGLVAEALAGRRRVVLGLSATCRFPGAPGADVLGELACWVPDSSRNVQVREAVVGVRISGIGNDGERRAAARGAAEELWATTLSKYLGSKLAAPDSRGRARALVVTSSYREAEAVKDGLVRAAGSDLTVRHLVRDAAAADDDPLALARTAVETFGGTTEPSVLVGPLSVVARGHNILQVGTDRSAICGVFVLTRPVPPSHDAKRSLAHVAYNARVYPPSWQGTAGATVEAERRDAWRRLRMLQRSPATFRRMDPVLRRELVCDVLVDLAQLAGRARRGGTPVDLVFVDGAFLDEVVPWRGLVHEVLGWWKENGWLSQMVSLHGAFVVGLAKYAGFALDVDAP